MKRTLLMDFIIKIPGGFVIELSAVFAMPIAPKPLWMMFFPKSGATWVENMGGCRFWIILKLGRLYTDCSQTVLTMKMTVCRKEKGFVYPVTFN